MSQFLSNVDYPGKDASDATSPNPLIVGHASPAVHRAAHILGAAQHPDLRCGGSGRARV